MTASWILANGSGSFIANSRNVSEPSPNIAANVSERPGSVNPPALLPLVRALETFFTPPRP
jgi:hypothetical protein